MRTLTALIVIGSIITFLSLRGGEEEVSAHMANGIKIGEVTAGSAIVWTRLTMHPERGDDEERRVPGTIGEVRVTYRPANDGASKQSTGWTPVDPEKESEIISAAKRIIRAICQEEPSEATGNA